MLTDDNGWERIFFYEVRFLGESAPYTETLKEYRCPVCYTPLRIGLNLVEPNKPEEEAGPGWEELGVNRHALMCPRETCRGYFRLTHK